jgi:mannosyltransferase OCH1-like enzyme
MKTWEKALWDYEFILWNFDKFNIHDSLWVKQAFEAKKYAYAADYIRLYAVYNYGGIYLDMDVEVLKPFDNLLKNEVMMAYEDKSKAIEAGCLGAEKHSPY